MRRLIAVVMALTALAPWGARADHIESVIGPGEPRREYPADFMELLPRDRQAQTAMFPQWESERVGGWGSDACPEGHEPRRPVLFIHGTTVDGWFWRADETSDGTIVNVRNEFLKAGYCERELWAISYDGAPGYFTYNDINVDEVTLWIEAVMSYLGVDRVDVVTHSLGVTVFRKLAYVDPSVLDYFENVVAIAGANHGTTTCRGIGTAQGSHVCVELEPGSEWLGKLNGFGETPTGSDGLTPRYLTIYSGANADNFYLGPDVESPRLAGACNVDMGAVAHNTLARGRAAVQLYLGWLNGASAPCS